MVDYGEGRGSENAGILITMTPKKKKKRNKFVLHFTVQSNRMFPLSKGV